MKTIILRQYMYNLQVVYNVSSNYAVSLQSGEIP
jgi:hypothetical protein